MCKENEIVPESCCCNRELSWLSFNERVLEEAEDVRVPLCERLNFLSIFQTNLDEFFMVRIGSLHDQMFLDAKARENKTNMTPGEQITAALDRIRVLCHRKDAVYHGLMSMLRDQGINLLDFHTIAPEEEPYFRDLFAKEFRPLISTYIIGKKQSFPFLQNGEIYAIGVLTKMTGKEKKKIGIVNCGSSVFPRLIPVPDRTGSYILAEELILHFLPELFDGYRVDRKTLARVTRNADIDADRIYDEDLDYRDHMEEVVRQRKKLTPVRLELSREMDDEIIRLLCGYMKLEKQQVFGYNSSLDFGFLSQISDMLRSHHDLFYAPHHPQASAAIDEQEPVMSQVEKHDILLHFPYQSTRPFLRMLDEASKDPSVVSIQMTLYRLARNSKVVSSLIEAAENGKQVNVLVELKARFDEANNIEWSRQLENAGCHVIYGIDGLKVHSKLCLITRHTEDGISFITQIGTGNYNENTSRFYTDLSLITARQEIGREVAEVFHALSLNETVDHMQYLLVAPHCLQNRLIDLIDGEIAKASAGQEGLIRLKMNSLTDRILMDKLIEASCAGVKIRMIVRGICCLKAGVPGKTENLQVISIVGRHLEHSRICIFGTGSEARHYIGSADWMTRNTLRRVEVLTPVEDPSLCQELDTIFDIMWNDNRQARVMQSDGSYVRRLPETVPYLAAQEILYDRAVQAVMKI